MPIPARPFMAVKRKASGPDGPSDQVPPAKKPRVDPTFKDTLAEVASLIMSTKGLRPPKPPAGKSTPKTNGDKDPTMLMAGPKAPTARIRKLAPPRPVVQEGEKNSICVTRKTKLGAYLKRCRQLFDDGHSTIRLYALGAAIPHMTLLATSLPLVLPGGVLKQEVTTSTVSCVDEIEPEDEDIDMSMRTRGKAAMQVVLRMRNEEPLKGGENLNGQKGKGKGKGNRQAGTDELRDGLVRDRARDDALELKGT